MLFAVTDATTHTDTHKIAQQTCMNKTE